MKARHLVTGAAGLIGFGLARELLEAGDEVVAVDTGKKGGLEDLTELERRHRGRLKVFVADLASDSKVFETHRVPACDSIFHFAAIVGVKYVCDHPYETASVNLRSTLNVLDHAIREGARTFVFASSSENYASGVDAGFVKVPTAEDVILSIDDIALPRWSYAASKIAGESALFGAALEGKFTPVVVRFHNVYGPRMGPTHVIPEFLKRCRERVDPFPVYGAEQTRSFLYIDDAARALRTLWQAASDEKGGIYNVGSPDETRIRDLVDVVFDVTGHHPKLDLRPAPKGSVARRVPDIKKLASLGFTPKTDLAAGVRACWGG